MHLKWLISSALAVFFIAAAGYLFWIPYDPDSLYRAVPANAVLVSSHRNLAQRRRLLETNIWLNPFFADETSAHASLDKPAPRSLSLIPRMIRLARRETVIAYLPPAGHTSQGTWMAASWIGPWSMFARWSLFWRQWPGIKELDSFAGRTIWELQTPLAGGNRLAFACGDGVILFCLSPDPARIRQVLLTYDGLLPSTRAQSELRQASESECPDVFWYQWRNAAGMAQSTLTGALSRFDEQGLAATARLQPSPFRQSPLAKSIDLAAAERLLGNLPALVVALPLPTLQDGLLTTADGSAGIQTIRRILHAGWIRQETNGVILALFTGEYGGGYGRKPFRLSAPVLMACARIRQPDNFPRIIAHELDLLNARHRLGLIQDPIPLPAGSHSIWTIEITSNNTLAVLEPEDRPAYALAGDWLIVSSQAGSLVKLMQRMPKPDNEDAPAPAAWRGAISGTNTSGLVWLDLDSGGKPLQLALSLWGLSQRTADNPSKPGNVKAAQTLLERIRPFQKCALWMQPEGSNAIVRVEIGTNKSAGQADYVGPDR